MNLAEIKNKLKQIKTTSFGISVPELRKFAKQIAKNDYRCFLDSNDFSTFELKLLHAFVIGYAKDDIGVLLNYFEKFVPYVDDWAVNDSLCQNFKIARKFQKEVWNFILRYRQSDKEFEIRIVAVILLSHYLNDIYIDRALALLDILAAENYYSQMGIAWAIATIMGKYPEKCRDYLFSNECHLNKSTLAKTISKIKESYRVSEETKKQIDNLNQINKQARTITYG